MSFSVFEAVTIRASGSRLPRSCADDNAGPGEVLQNVGRSSARDLQPPPAAGGVSPIVAPPSGLTQWARFRLHVRWPVTPA